MKGEGEVRQFESSPKTARLLMAHFGSSFDVHVT